VIEFVETKGACIDVEKSEWGKGSIILRSKSRSVFLNGFMHMVEYSAIVVVNTEGKTWRTIHKPSGAEMSIHQA
jgi:hypothetical protein